MNKPALVAVSTFLLALTLLAPATAQTAHRARNAHAARVTTAAGDPNLPVENALRWGYSQGYSYYPSGFGGLYGDGRYPGNVISSGKDRP
jgi:hypothetical protein